tara:strand:+ start:1015 stop:1188 length:174 start_codon:yes stop_codon:yes gene_type:complete
MNDDFVERLYRKWDKENNKKPVRQATLLRWLFRLYISYSIVADVIVMIGIIYLIFNL